MLVVEDERDIRELLRRYLVRAGLSVVVASTGAEALLELEEARPDLVLLDLGLPDIDGREILARADSRHPGHRPHRPARPSRTGSPGCAPAPTTTSSSRSAPRRSSCACRRCSPGGRAAARPGPLLRRRPARGRPGPARGAPRRACSLSLTPSEWNLLVALTSTPGRVFSRHELVERIGGSAFDGYERAVDSHVKNLRHKLGPDGQHVVETVVGFGYRCGARADD